MRRRAIAVLKRKWRPRRAALAAAEQQLAVSKATANKTHTLLEYARITAPFAGVITHRYADTGAMIQAGTSSQTQTMPVVQLSENDRLRLIIQVPESAVSHIRVGEPVDVRVESLGRTFPGVIARFAGKVNAETRTMETEVDVQNANLTLVPGMYAYASIALERTQRRADRARAGAGSRGRQGERARRERRTNRAARRAARPRDAGPRGDRRTA